MRQSTRLQLETKKLLCRLRVLVMVSVVLLVQADPACSWGPHPAITAAALETLPDREGVRTALGPEWNRLAHEYCKMGDFRQDVRPDYYPDDYLLFPSSPNHVMHVIPAVRATFIPFFWRALQALRTESPQNAARWVGSLLHYVEDAGAPPHSIRFVPPLHKRMETWVDDGQIGLPGYRPCLLGTSDEAALEGLLRRVEGLFAFSRTRAIRLRPRLASKRVRIDQPLELECALEAARATADVAHTLFRLGLSSPGVHGGRLEGRVDRSPLQGYPSIPAKIVLQGTGFSTVADGQGLYAFRNLPAGQYTVGFLATGSESMVVGSVHVRSGRTCRLDARLRTDPVEGNVVRNPRFALEWTALHRPDFWMPEEGRPGFWVSAPIRVPCDRACALRLEWTGHGAVPVEVRWKSKASATTGYLTVPLECSPDGSSRVSRIVLTAPREIEPRKKNVVFLQLVLGAGGDPAATCRHVSVRLVNP